MSIVDAGRKIPKFIGFASLKNCYWALEDLLHSQEKTSNVKQELEDKTNECVKERKRGT